MALDAGANKEEVLETLSVVVSMRGTTGIAESLRVIKLLEELGELVLAHAISIHKSQGSEYRAVVIPILSQHYILLQRNLLYTLYTALTRARQLVVLVGSKRAIAIAVRNNKVQHRYTNLAARLLVH